MSSPGSDGPTPEDYQPEFTGSTGTGGSDPAGQSRSPRSPGPGKQRQGFGIPLPPWAVFVGFILLIALWIAFTKMSY